MQHRSQQLRTQSPQCPQCSGSSCGLRQPLGPPLGALPPCSAWPDRPCLLRCAAADPHTRDPQTQRVGVPFAVKSRLFEGRAVVRIKGVSEADDSKYFRDRERKVACLVQGQFTRRVRCSDVVCGQEFDRPLALLSRRREVCHSAAPSSPFSRHFNRDGEGVPAK